MVEHMDTLFHWVTHSMTPTRTDTKESESGEAQGAPESCQTPVQIRAEAESAAREG